jgi:hypothetical protein
MSTRAILAVGIMAGLVGVTTAHAGPTPQAKCNEAKAKAAGKKAAALLKAFAKNISKDPDTKLAGSVSKAESKFTRAFTNAEAKGGCLNVGDSGDIEAETNTYVAAVLEKLASSCPGEAPNVGGSCWYLGGANDSCTTTCSGLGLLDDSATNDYAAASDGNCIAVLDALAVPPGALNTFGCFIGVGCYYDSNTASRNRCDNGGPPGNAIANAERACACME